MIMQPLETLVHSRMFFDRKPSKTVPVFIFSILFMLLAFFVWAATMKMDDVVKAQAADDGQHTPGVGCVLFLT